MAHGTTDALKEKCAHMKTMLIIFYFWQDLSVRWVNAPFLEFASKLLVQYDDLLSGALYPTGEQWGLGVSDFRPKDKQVDSIPLQQPPFVD